jgi:hypothetical protein
MIFFSKLYRIRARCNWEHLGERIWEPYGNPMETWWVDIRNKGKKKCHLPPLWKGKNRSGKCEGSGGGVDGVKNRSGKCTDKELIHIKIDTSHAELSLKFIGKLFSKGPVWRKGNFESTLLSFSRYVLLLTQMNKGCVTPWPCHLH